MINTMELWKQLYIKGKYSIVIESNNIGQNSVNKINNKERGYVT